MTHVFTVLAAEYDGLLGAMAIDPKRAPELKARGRMILARAESHDWNAVTAATGVPKLWGLASFERESSSDYSRSPAQGDPWRQVSTHVPRGLGPYKGWAEAAIAAYRLDNLDKVGAANWTWARACYEGELFNGFGYRAHNIHSPYLWSWTNIYTRGKFVADGKFNPHQKDQQCGIAPLMLTLQQLDASLGLTGRPPKGPIAAPEPVPIGAGGGQHDAAWIQAQLNTRGTRPPLVIDNHYGRMTRRAVAEFQAAHQLTTDGLAGPETIAALERTA